MKKKSMKFSIMIKCQKKVLIVFVYLWYWLTVFKIGKNCYSQVFLEEFKYITTEKITKDLEISSDSDESCKENHTK